MLLDRAEGFELRVDEVVHGAALAQRNGALHERRALNALESGDEKLPEALFAIADLLPGGVEPWQERTHLLRHWSCIDAGDHRCEPVET